MGRTLTALLFAGLVVTWPAVAEPVTGSMHVQPAR